MRAGPPLAFVVHQNTAIHRLLRSAHQQPLLTPGGVGGAQLADDLPRHGNEGTLCPMPGWLQFVGAIGIGALLASAVQAGVAWLNGNADRAHESELRAADRTHEKELRLVDNEHERRMEAMTDRRAHRDRRADRIYANLLRIAAVGVAMRDEVQRLRLRPQDYTKLDPNLKEAVDAADRERPALLLDAETEALFHRVGVAMQGWNSFWVAVDNREHAKNTSERLGEYSKEMLKAGDELSELLVKIIAEAREALAKAEAALE